MARSWAENDLAKVREYFAKGVRIIMLTTFPIAAILAVLRVPIIQVVLERGAFDHRATVAVANVMLILLAGPFICGGLGNVVWKGFYISQKTRLSAGLSVTNVAIYIIVAYFLSKSFSYIGLAWAITIQSLLGILVGMIGMKFVYKGINGKNILANFLKILVACLLSGTFSYYSFHMFTLKATLILSVALAAIVASIVYSLSVIYLFKIDEAVAMKVKVADFFKSKLAFVPL
ncbi:unnamed protein product [marine sediment metagenome]|uniref:Polysaccharide biosynthesis protein C-terminal domain-containing protein n=1 Tax=marine sediment metagenome TaxID=412755 RepID=X1HBW8_9ZZZZ